jgi:hypothetical protein
LNQSKEILYTISVLQKEIDNIDHILKNGHLLVDGTEKLESERKFLQVGIYPLINLSN